MQLILLVRVDISVTIFMIGYYGRLFCFCLVLKEQW